MATLLHDLISLETPEGEVWGGLKQRPCGKRRPKSAVKKAKRGGDTFV